MQALIEACMEEDGKLYLCVSSPTIKDKPVSPTQTQLSVGPFPPARTSVRLATPTLCNSILRLFNVWDMCVWVCLQVQIRPWNLSDSDFVMDGSQPLDPRKTIFVGGVPRPLRAGRGLVKTDVDQWIGWWMFCVRSTGVDCGLYRL